MFMPSAAPQQPPILPLPSPGSLPVLQPPLYRVMLAPIFGMTMDWYKERGPQRQPWTGCPQQGSDQSLWEKSLSTNRVWIRPYPGPEQFVPVLCHVCEMLLLSGISFSLSPVLLFFHPESFQLGALQNSRGFNTTQQVWVFFFFLYFTPPPSSLASFIQSVSKHFAGGNKG